MMKKTMITIAALATVAFVNTAHVNTAQARDQIRIVGSSTVYPFATVVAEQFGKSTKFKTPVVESTGSGGGLKLFCAGVGVRHPDITNASRAIKKSEIKRCAKNGVTNVTEVKVGYDGIVIANSKASKQLNLTKKHIFLALAKKVPAGEGNLIDNPYKMWSDIDKFLPNVKIEVLGPPPTSGTRDAFVELAMEGGCKTFKWIKKMKKQNKKKYKALCHGIREDGAFVEAGENDVLIVKKLEANPKAFGIFGYSFLDQNADKIQGSKIAGAAPTFENISAGKYGVSRPLYLYVKNAHVGKIPGIKEFLNEFTSEKAWGPDGYLADKGLIPMPETERNTFRADAAANKKNLM
jgi:phosphate transport system substrate-binding protein